MIVGSPDAFAVSVTEEPLQIVGDTGVIVTVGGARVIPVNPTNGAMLFTPVDVTVLAPVFAALYFTHGKAPAYLPISMLASVPTISPAR